MNTSITQEQTKTAPAKATTEARVAKRPPHVAPTEGKPARKAANGKKAAPARPGSKTAKILDLLKRPGGVTLEGADEGNRLASAFGPRLPERHSRAGRWGLRVESSKRADGERSYRLSSK